MSTTCGHLICELGNIGSCAVAVDTQNYGMGGPIESTEVPQERIAHVQALLNGLDREAVRAELARRRLERDVEALLEILKEERYECSRTQDSARIRERAGKLLAMVGSIKSVEDLKTKL